MTSIPLARRISLALAALTIAGLMFRPQIVGALVTRGDDARRSGDLATAIRFYQRALTADQASTTAADRLAFLFLMRRQVNDAGAAIAIASRALATHTDDAVLLADRALGYQLLHRWAEAQRDYARAGAISKDARYEHFAGRIALLHGDRREARRHFRRAVADDPRFAPAHFALQSLGMRR